MNTNIREASLDDLPFLARLEQQAFEPFQQNTYQSLKNGILSSFQSVFILEEKDTQKPAGAMVLFKYKKSLRLYSLAVLPEYQNKGLGNIFIDFFRSYAIKNHYANLSLEVHSNNDKLISWYANKGFEKVVTLKNYYQNGDDGIKMRMRLTIPDEKEKEKNKNIIVIDRPFKWERPEVNATIISVKDYINQETYQNNVDLRIFNLCSSYKYQSYGYYISLLASARGQRVIPSIATIRDFRSNPVIQSAAYELEEMVNQVLQKNKGTSFSLDIYFGQTPSKSYKSLAVRLYQIFEAPLFKINFIKDDNWLIKNIKVLTINDVPENHKMLMYDFAAKYFKKKRHNYPKLTNYMYDLAVLVNPEEENPPSDKEALKKLKKAANKKGVYLEFITKSDIDKINEFDALFIRETTNVNHHTYEISRLAYAEGLVVIDDPWSILKCSNKIYQNELFRKHKIRTPNTVVLTKNMFVAKQLDEFNYPMVLKQPDSAFSLGVSKVNNKQEAEEALNVLFKRSDMIICQEFLYSEFDWRVGILDNKPLFACKYFMSKDHWQIYDWNSTDEDKSGDSETLAIEDVPEKVLKTAQKAAGLIGDGLYGVDLKMVGNKVYVVEVNDNPNLDAGIEDFILKDELYEMVIESIINRIEIAKNIRKINLTGN